MTLTQWVSRLDEIIWGPGMLALLVGTGIFLSLRTRFLPWRNMGYALRCVLSREARSSARGPGDVSPFSALMTALAATIGTGNIVGVATALVSGGPGALVWMELSALFGVSSKFSECMLAVKYRERNDRGEMSGGPMYVLKNGLGGRLGALLGGAFALFAMAAALGIGDMTQANSIAISLRSAFGLSPSLTGAVLTVLTLGIVLGGIKSISRIASVVVPAMAVLYLSAGLLVILGNLPNLPAAMTAMFRMAFSAEAVSGGAVGAVTASMADAARYGVARGCFSNEAGLGSAAITAASASAKDPVGQGYINMTGTFFDTFLVCTVTGLAICSSGMLGALDPATGQVADGAALTMLAFSTVLGERGAALVTVCITLFAFSTILGWEYHGEKAFEFLFGSRRVLLYRVIYALAVYVGATEELTLIWGISDIFNALMAIPNLLGLLLLSGVVSREIRAYEPQVALRRQAWRRGRKRR
jgi:AGCS family alanine or glycine:cation symporter